MPGDENNNEIIKGQRYMFKIIDSRFYYKNLVTLKV